ncbi:MAG: hypothetical protein A2491_21515 [Bacteroidetes bacterium RIFOXYC12_FULL_35_7]|nr:MAG: hypothetical protein A2491_21515 [Bacteroidetes bacterium RIFOXYC12_FULL_35_7]
MACGLHALCTSPQSLSSPHDIPGFKSLLFPTAISKKTGCLQPPPPAAFAPAIKTTQSYLT